MSDRELLEKAAKAAGIELDYAIRSDGKVFYHSERNALARADLGWFAPLNDDGDALRLAVKLNLTVKIMGDHVKVGGRGHWEPWIGEEAPISCEMLAATRRAIVRAAAQLGEQP